VIVFPNEEKFEMWDDCMSFPGLEVRLAVQRALNNKAYRIDRKKSGCF
jgi:hypothetical protein